MKLHYREYGSYSESRATLILLHGLLGSSANWHGIARKLEPGNHIIVPDLRNHGASPHADRADYPAVGADVLELIEEHGLDSVLLVGHSMGGKAAMWLALRQPECVAGLVVVDIAPVRYEHEFDTIFRALRSINPVLLQNRGEADRLLAGRLSDPGLRQYLLQNLTRREGEWYWRANLDALEAAMADIVGFPDIPAAVQYPGPAFFLYGTASDYVRPEHQPRIRALFPRARMRSLVGAGHWLYAQRPDEFLSAVRRFVAGRH